MKESDTRNRDIIIRVIVYGLILVFAAFTIRSLSLRNYSAKQACIDNLRTIDAGKEQQAMAYSLPEKLKTPDERLPTREQALNVASNLTYGMSEAEAASFLETNGFIKISFGGVGDSFWLTRFCRLSDGTLFCLEIRPKNMRADNAWGDGTLEAAYIREENTTNIVVTIELHNQVALQSQRETGAT